MKAPDREVALLLRDRPDLLAVADAIAATQREPRRARTTRGRSRILALAATAAVVLAVALTAPWRGHGEDVVARALAAVGNGPVIHAVIDSNLRGVQIVDLKTGRHTPVIQQLEYWYDGRRHELRFTISIGGRVLTEGLTGPSGSQLDPALAAFATRYRDVLASGQAHVVRRGAIAGHRVVWLRLRTTGIFGEGVALDAATYRPLVVVKLDPLEHQRALWRVREIATEARNPADFVRPRPAPAVHGEAHPTREVAPEKAERYLGWRPLWLGGSFAGDRVAYAQIQSLTSSVSATALPVFAVSYGRGVAGGVLLEESRQPALGFRLGAPAPETESGVPLPPPGQAVVAVTGRTCQVQLRAAGGLYVSILGRRAMQCIAAARALRPLASTR